MCTFRTAVNRMDTNFWPTSYFCLTSALTLIDGWQKLPLDGATCTIISSILYLKIAFSVILKFYTFVSPILGMKLWQLCVCFCITKTSKMYNKLNKFKYQRHENHSAIWKVLQLFSSMQVPYILAYLPSKTASSNV